MAGAVKEKITGSSSTTEKAQDAQSGAQRMASQTAEDVKVAARGAMDAASDVKERVKDAFKGAGTQQQQDVTRGAGGDRTARKENMSDKVKTHFSTAVGGN